MLQALGSEIRECYQRAVECSRGADQTGDTLARQDFLEMQKRWLSLAHSYEFAEELSNIADKFVSEPRINCPSR